MYEAARVDAPDVQPFFLPHLPMISPAIFFSLVINMISSFGGVLYWTAACLIVV